MIFWREYIADDAELPLVSQSVEKRITKSQQVQQAAELCTPQQLTGFHNS